jgi:hypothetical protein
MYKDCAIPVRSVKELARDVRGPHGEAGGNRSILLGQHGRCNRGQQ